MHHIYVVCVKLCNCVNGILVCWTTYAETHPVCVCVGAPVLFLLDHIPLCGFPIYHVAVHWGFPPFWLLPIKLLWTCV